MPTEPWCKGELTLLDESIADRAQLRCLFAAWDNAREHYEHVLEHGVNRSDRELARDDSYRKLVIAGSKIVRYGGQDAIVAAAVHLGGKYSNGCESHFDRLWCGLMPEPQAQTLN